jgi:cytosine/uracil/thiamine/allantoin permease
MSGFDILIWAGALVTMAGVIGLMACVIWVVRLRRSGVSEDQQRAGMQRVVAYNMGALFASTIGLMMVVMGIFLK